MSVMGRFLIIVLCNISFFIVAEQKRALIFGITGQDGIYLTEFLLQKNYIVHGVKRKGSVSNVGQLDDLREKFQGNIYLHEGDVANIDNIIAFIQNIEPNEIYNLAAQSNVRMSFDIAEYTMDVNAMAVLRILEAMVKIDKAKKIRFYQASSSEMFGKVQGVAQNELTSFYPRSPYGFSKLCGYWMARNYREMYGIFVCNGILFNHESPLRGEDFVTRKISMAVAKVHKGMNEVLYLGNLDARRDWGYAKDYVQAMWLILQQDTPDDYVIATGKTHSVRDFVELAFNEISISIAWRGEGIHEEGFDKDTGALLVKVDPVYFRPIDIDETVGDAKKAREVLHWQPATSFQELVKIMVQEDMRRLQ